MKWLIWISLLLEVYFFLQQKGCESMLELFCLVDLRIPTINESPPPPPLTFNEIIQLFNVARC